MTVGIQTPIIGKRPGDISFKAIPEPGGYIGHVFADNDWRRWGVISIDKDETFLTLDRVGIGETGGSSGFVHDSTADDAFQVNGVTRIDHLFVGGAVTFSQNQTFSGVTYETVTVKDEIVLTGTAGTDNYVFKVTDADKIAQFSNVEITGAAFTFGNNTQVTVENSFESNFTGVSTFKGTVAMGQLEVVGLASGAIGIFTSVECEFLQVGTAASIKLGFATDFYVYDDLVVQSNAYVNTGVVTTIEGSDLTYDEITGTTVQAVGLRATNFATPNAKINVGIITTLIVPPYNVNTGDSWAGISTAYIGVGIVTTLIVPAGGWIGAPNAYINSGIVTTISGTDATYTNVNANNVYSPYIAGQTGGNPAGAGVLYVQNAQVGSKLWLSGTAAGEGLRANVGIITYFGHNAKNVLGNLDSNGNNMHINAGSDGIVQASQFRSTIAQGAAPFTVVSTTKVTNLNVDLLDNKSATSAATPDTIMSRNSSANTAVNKLTSATIDNSGNIETNTLGATPQILLL